MTTLVVSFERRIDVDHADNNDCGRDDGRVSLLSSWWLLRLQPELQETIPLKISSFPFVVAEAAIDGNNQHEDNFDVTSVK